MRLDPDDRLSRLIYCEEFEWQERQFLKAFLRPGDVFVDVGANIGLYTVIAGHHVGDGGRVYALEPSARAFERLQINVALNGLTNVVCDRVALSDRVTQLAMTVSEDGFDAWNTFGRPTAGALFTETAVHCVTWDEFVKMRNLFGRVTMMKIDVEGWETRVLEGGAKTLSHKDAPVLQVEFTDEAARLAGSSCVELYHTLENFGYQMFLYDAESEMLFPEPLREEYPYLNLIATKRPEKVMARLKGWLGPT